MQKRFIAGAVCPACQRSDTLAYWYDDNHHHAECIICGHILTEAKEEKVTSYEKLPSIARFRAG